MLAKEGSINKGDCWSPRTLQTATLFRAGPRQYDQRRKEAERRRLERERLERLEKARVGRLLAQAKSLREAEEIRAYVSAVRARQAALDDPLSATGFQQWADWALSQADRIESCLAASEQFKTTIEARQRRLILGGAGGSCDGLLRVGDRRK